MALGLKEVILEFSGGKDSTYSLHLLKKRGFSVLPVFLFLHDSFKELSERARSIADYFSLKLEILDLRDAFYETVIDYFVSEYAKGKTPNPCVVCNKKIKFGIISSFMDKKGIEFLATGHYAKVESGRLFESKYIEKSQAYFLSMVERGMLKRVVLPMGDIHPKSSLNFYKKIHSGDYRGTKDICFLQRDYRDFLKERLGEMPGPIYDTSGKLLGFHKGIYQFTVGQRKGLGISVGEPLYVVKIDPKDGAVYVGRKEELLKDRVFVREASWINPPATDFLGNIRVRYRTRRRKAFIKLLDNGFLAELFEKQEAPAPGQVCVVNVGEEVLGGGFIEDVQV